jgi:hypothetical protein
VGVGVPIRHLDEIYKRRLLDAEVPRRGDLAEVVRDHCSSAETGLLVEVVNDPHRCEVYCAECGQKVVEYFVEVKSHIFDRKAPGPHFYPIKWLKRAKLS